MPAEAVVAVRSVTPTHLDLEALAAVAVVLLRMTELATMTALQTQAVVVVAALHQLTLAAAAALELLSSAI